MYADSMTLKSKRLTYARICVEVDATRPLPDSFDLCVDDDFEDNAEKLLEIHVEYQWKPKMCSDCQVFGHQVNSCPKKVNMPTTKPQPTKAIWKATGVILPKDPSIMATEGVTGAATEQQQTNIPHLHEAETSIQKAHMRTANKEDTCIESTVNHLEAIEALVAHGPDLNLGELDVLSPSARRGSGMVPTITNFSTSVATIYPNRFDVLQGEEGAEINPDLGLTDLLATINGGAKQKKKGKNKVNPQGGMTLRSQGKPNDSSCFLEY
ncbi:hypothetical protein AMTR_s04453p00001630 [Amborella trichopoda]|uniref:Zinc knuckle CX2CX4HX4C domain-containing protein n=1 Tax=Amborella trichopoda TaxID=13333 RepID=U5CUJ0_AMBTC|nr:hypothetical protein AMTR_s04453p00001630 [Amborella trichopoda]